MGQVTRQEVSELLAKFEVKCVPKEMSIGMPGILLAGINMVKHELNSTSGAPSVRLRNFARVLKHYVEEAPKDPNNINYFNHVIHQVNRGVDVTKAVKRVRTELRPERMQADLKRAMKKLADREELHRVQSQATVDRALAMA
jgi:hypothetical protein